MKKKLNYYCKCGVSIEYNTNDNRSFETFRIRHCIQFCFAILASRVSNSKESSTLSSKGSQASIIRSREHVCLSCGFSSANVKILSIFSGESVSKLLWSRESPAGERKLRGKQICVNIFPHLCFFE